MARDRARNPNSASREPGQKEAAGQIAGAFAWAGQPDRFRNYTPAKPHCYDQEIQEEALAWFNQHLKPAKK